uniref:Uncharacterized protein n=1 Tax=Anguilla anguilla TaxID=7936 RepID=A0A0E9QKV8_ANGAN
MEKPQHKQLHAMASPRRLNPGLPYDREGSGMLASYPTLALNVSVI